MSLCVFCCEEIGRGSATTPCCFQTVCTTCLLNNVAKNVGTEEGTTRSKCPFCREELCGEVEPSQNITTRLNDLTDWAASAAEELEKAERTEKMFRRGFKLQEDDIKDLTKSRDAAWHENEALEMNLIEKSRIIGVLNHDIDYLRTIITTSHQFADHLETHEEDALQSSTKIQSWWRGILGQRFAATVIRRLPISASGDTRWPLQSFTAYREEVKIKGALNKIEQDVMYIVESQGLVCSKGISIENINCLSGKHLGNILSLYGQTKKHSGESVMDQRTRLVDIIYFRDEWVVTSGPGRRCETVLNGWSVNKIREARQSPQRRGWWTMRRCGTWGVCVPPCRRSVRV
jgi:hypothetical protein